VVVVPMAADQAAAVADRVRRRMERARAGQAKTSGVITVAAGVLPVPAGELVAPETILCATGWGLRAAMAQVANAVVRLPVLAVQPDGEGGKNDGAS